MSSGRNCNSILDSKFYGTVVITRDYFCEEANRIFNKYNLSIPNSFPNLKKKNRNVRGLTLETSAWDEFTNCVACCIMIENNYNINTNNILKKELLEPNSRSGILHANTLASIAYNYLLNGHRVDILPSFSKGRKIPDLIIDDFECEIKVIDETDWLRDFNYKTGTTKEYTFSEDICYDIGTFISKKDSGHKGIKQADIVFADLSYKSFGFIPKIEMIEYTGLPELKKYRIIFLSKKITKFCSFYIDFQNNLWDIIKNSTNKHSFVILPWKTT